MAWVVVAAMTGVGCARETESRPRSESSLQAGLARPPERRTTRLKPGLRTSDDVATPADVSISSEQTRVRGRVADEDGRPIADVVVELAPDADELSEDWIDGHTGGACYGKVDAAGAFSFDGLAPGRYRAKCDLLHAPPAVVVESGTLDAVLVVPRAALPRRVAVNVVALDASGAPFRGRAGSHLRYENRRSVDALLEDGRSSLCVEAACHADLCVEDRDTDEQFRIEDVQSRDEPYVFTFGRSPMIRGRVVAEIGARPVDERELRVSAAPDPLGAEEIRSVPVHDDGTFAVAVPHAGRYRLVAYGNVGREPSVCRWSSAGDDVEIRLPAPSSFQTLDLVLHLPDGRVATDFCVRAVDSTGEYDVDAGGPSVVVLPPGRTWRLTIRVKAGDDWFGPTTLDGLRTGGPPIDVPLAPSPTIDGVVVRRDGTPVVRARVRASSNSAPLVENATTGLDGRFRLVGLAPGEWTLTAETDALETSPRLVVAAGSHDVRVVAMPRRAPF
jgi:hypothetical protein